MTEIKVKNITAEINSKGDIGKILVDLRMGNISCEQTYLPIPRKGTSAGCFDHLLTQKVLSVLQTDLDANPLTGLTFPVVSKHVKKITNKHMDACDECDGRVNSISFRRSSRDA